MFRFVITNLNNDFTIWTGTEITSDVIEKLVDEGVSTSDMGMAIEEID